MSQPPIHILVVDDEPVLCALTKEFLERPGDIVVDTANSVREAMDDLAKNHYDAIVSDYQMPQEDGIQFLKSLRQKENMIPFILFTGKGREEIVIEALNNGADSYLQKGGTPKPMYAELEHRIRAVVRRHRSENALRESEGKFRGLYDTIKDGIVRVGMDGIILECNQAYLEMTGYTLEELERLTYMDITPEKWHDMEKEIISNFAINTGHSEGYEKEYRRKDGVVIPISLRVWLIRDGHGSPIHMWGIVQDITERKRAEEKLLSNEERLRLITDNMSDMVWLIDMQMRPTWMSPSVFRDSGFTLEELASIPIDRQMAPRSLQKVMSAMTTMLTPENLSDPGRKLTFADELEFYRKDGSTQWNDVVYSVLRDEMGRPTSILAVGRNITGRKRAEDALRESEQRYRTILDQAAEIIIMHDDTGRIMDVNQKACQILGYSHEELCSMTIDNINVDLTQAKKHELWGEILTGGSFTFECDLIRKDGSTIPMEVTLGSVHLPRGPAILALVRDITGRKRAEEALRESEEKYRMLFDNAADAIFINDLESSTMLAVNQMAMERLGYTWAELMSMTIDQVDSLEQGEQIPERVARLMERGWIRFETVHRRKDGSSVPIEATARLITWNGRPAVMSISHDITERKLTEKALHEANRKLNLLSRITRHDINNQLMMLAGNLTLLENKQIDHQSDEHLQKAEAAAERISTMIKFTKTYEDIGVKAPIWQDVRTLVMTASGDVPLEKMRVVNDVPAGTEVFADPLVVKVFHNLIQNSMRHGGKITTIRFSLEENEGVHTIICEDDGVGISRDMKMKLFTQGFGKDHGLGLFLSREILAMTGITIEEVGRPKHGAKFVLTIPNDDLKGPRTNGP